METILAQLIGGLLGGAAGPKIVKDADIGSIGNLLAGGLGGLGGGTILKALLGLGTGGLDFGALAGQFVGGGLAGAIVQVIVGLLINKVLRKA